jgi:signal transduction histidine kinase
MGEVARQLDAAFLQREALEQEVLTRQAAETLARARESQLQEVVRDRERFLQDLHDGLIQSLFGLGLRLESCRNLVETRQEEAARRALEECTQDINAALRDLRRSITESASLLRSIRSLDKSITLLLRQLAQPGRTEFTLDASVALDPLFSADQSAELFAVVSEACINIIRHADAKKASIAITGGPDGKVRIRIQDDGCGFDPSKGGAGLGLAGMRRRIARLGGEARVESERGKGTVLVMELPAGKQEEG